MSSGSWSLAVVVGPTSAAATATGAASQLAVEHVVALQPATASSNAPNPKILRGSPLLWTFPRLDGSALPMSHLTPVVGSAVWPGGYARGNKSRNKRLPANMAKVKRAQRHERLYSQFW